MAFIDFHCHLDSKDFDIDRLDGAFIKTDDKIFRKIRKDYLKRLIK